MSTTTYCDRCGDPGASPHAMGSVNLGTSKNGYSSSPYRDLCQSCREDLRDLILFWLENSGIDTDVIADWALRDSPA